jgi:hypothetical protein
MQRLINLYTELHEGRAPDRILKQKLPGREPKYFIELGPMYEASYLKKTAEDNEYHPYRHPFADWAMPTLVHDDRGKLHILDQENLTVTTRGIEDQMAKRSKSIARLNPHAGARMVHARHNPFGVQAVKKVAISAGAVGVGAALTGIGIGMGLQFLAEKWKKQDGSPMLSGYAAAGAAAGAGVLAAVGIQSLSKGNDIAEIAAAAVGIGGVVAGTNIGVANYRADHPSAPPAPPAQGIAQGVDVHAPVVAPEWRR